VREAPSASVLTQSRPTEIHRNRRPVCWQCGGTGISGERDLEEEIKGLRTPTAELEAALERKAGGQRRDLLDRASGRRRPSSPMEGAAGQQPSESSPETSDRFYRAQWHLRAEMSVVHVGRWASYLEATQDEQP
jgi:hypothetical protein